MTEKRAEFVFIVLLAVVVAFFIQARPSFTGYATYTPEDAKSLLEQALGASLFQGTSSANLCVVIKDSGSFNVIKDAAGFTATLTQNEYCDGIASEDIIIKFPDYDSFVSLASDPTAARIMEANKQQQFHILPSKLVQSGGNVICDAEFKVKYCSSAGRIGSAEELIQGDLVCCVDTLTTEQKTLLKQHYSEGGFVDESAAAPTLNIPFSIPFGISPKLLAGGVISFCLLLLLLVVVIKMSSKPKQAPVDPKLQQLTDYVKQTISEGYQEEQIRQYLLKEGWTEDKVNSAFNDAKKSLNMSVSIPSR